jgi:pimeloyl-ACP methyl ester carboxylesterase
MHWIGGVLAVLIATVAISYVVEAVRRHPSVPRALSWSPATQARSVDVDGVNLRYIVAGEGPPLVLLHTLRTQLDMFQKVIPRLAGGYRVYALDYPGHGWSDIPDARYDAEFFVATVSKALDRLDVKNAVVVGESIGGTIALLLAARHHPRVRAVVAINPYDYDRGRGLRRSSLLANLIFGLNDVPILGATVNRLRSRSVVTRIFQGGLHRKGTLPNDLAREMYLVGNRPGHSRATGSLIHHWKSWEEARAEYGAIDRPVLLVYGDHDWSHEGERAADAQAIPAAELRVVRDAGHFLSLDAPDEMLAQVLPWVRSLPSRSAGAV